MSQHSPLLILATSLVLAISGCQQAAAPAAGNPAAAQPGPAVGTNAVPASNSSAMNVTPATIATCNPGVVATVHWDAQRVHVTTSNTEVWVGSNPKDLKLFAAGGSQGQAQTGTWTHPGTRFVLKNKDDGKVLGDATVGGPSCP
jgi:hypothetical protein